MRLYEISEDMKSLQALVDDGEMTAVMIGDTMDGLNIAFKDKATAALKVRQHLLADVAAIELEIERLTKLKTAPENNANRLAEYIKGNMEAISCDKLDLGVFKLTLKKPTRKLGHIDEDKLGIIFWRVIPESRSIDKRALLAAAKESPIDGVEIIDGSRALIIK
jgi:hypothetical protein